MCHKTWSFLLVVEKLDTKGLYIAGFVMILFFVAAFFVIRDLRKDISESEKNSDLNCFGLTFEQIDEMFDSGQISAEERAAMRKVVADGFSGKEKVTVSDVQVDIIKKTDVAEGELVELFADEDDEEEDELVELFADDEEDEC